MGWTGAISGPRGAGVRLRRLAGLVLIAAVAGCTTLYQNHGYVPAMSDVAALRPGIDTQQSVTKALGTPTAGGVLGSGNAYWVASRFRHFGAFAPVEVDRQVLALDFDAAGTLRNIERYGLADGRMVALSRNVTDDNLRDTTFLRQLVSGIGRFDAASILGSE